ncbi:hypothetical protein ABEY05_20035 [Bacillus subtilis]|uniref:hypothetical protein n=1 Tax=Bacillus sp. LR_6 TaxID=3055785 RepID=UPI0035C16A9F
MGINRGYVKLIRFHNNGFNTTPYNSSTFCHSLPFINYEVTDLGMKNEIIKEPNIIRPKINDQKWKGCFVFLEEYDEQLLKKGALVMRKNHKKNTSFLKVENQTIWVRNTPHTGKEDCYVNQYIEVIEHEGEKYSFNKYLGTYSNLYWVQMTINLALKRLVLGKQHLGYVPEWLSEAYIMDDQVNCLESSKLFVLKEHFKRMMGKERIYIS